MNLESIRKVDMYSSRTKRKIKRFYLTNAMHYLRWAGVSESGINTLLFIINTLTNIQYCLLLILPSI